MQENDVEGHKTPTPDEEKYKSLAHGSIDDGNVFAHAPANPQLVHLKRNSERKVDINVSPSRRKNPQHANCAYPTVLCAWNKWSVSYHVYKYKHDGPTQDAIVPSCVLGMNKMQLHGACNWRENEGYHIYQVVMGAKGQKWNKNKIEIIDQYSRLWQMGGAVGGNNWCKSEEVFFFFAYLT